VSEVTRLLDAIDCGETKRSEELLPLVYEELRRLAYQQMARLPPGQTLQPTALVHEAWLRLAGDRNAPSWNSRGHFFIAAAEAMRRILVEKARRKDRLKHGGEFRRIDLDTLNLATSSEDEQILAVHDALDKYAVEDPLGAQLIKLRFFVGLPNIEAARLLGIPERTAKRSWAYARAWLHEELKKRF
jgi:RNA polymerase sigma factor (TIGR02999 family)